VLNTSYYKQKFINIEAKSLKKYWVSICNNCEVDKFAAILKDHNDILKSLPQIK